MREALEVSRRERQILDIIYARGEASATDVVEQIPDAPTRTSIRTLLRILEEKGHLRHRKQGREYLYAPTRPRQKVGQSAFRRVLQIFFDGSLEKAVAAHLADPSARVNPAELQRLASLVRRSSQKE
jgi:BlaI family transcriptional regulator, penicillinase repressor